MTNKEIDIVANKVADILERRHNERKHKEAMRYAELLWGADTIQSTKEKPNDTP